MVPSSFTDTLGGVKTGMRLLLVVRSFRIKKFSDTYRMMQGLNGPTRQPPTPASLAPRCQPELLLVHLAAKDELPCAGHEVKRGSTRKVLRGQDRCCELMKETWVHGDPGKLRMQGQRY